MPGAVLTAFLQTRSCAQIEGGSVRAEGHEVRLASRVASLPRVAGVRL
jgi:hypothetical protein